MLLLDRLQEILILHRHLDFQDEDATLEEQGEKILYFYSSTLNASDIKEQLSIATLAEALIELTKKFSASNNPEAIQTVVMHRKFWSFLEIENGIWIIISFLNNSEAITSAKYNPNNITSDQFISDTAFHNFLSSFYNLYFTMNGTISSSLLGTDGQGMICVTEIMMIQKKIRKLRKKLFQKEGDLKRQQDDPTSFVPESNETMEEMNSQLSLFRQQLTELLCSPSYTLIFLRNKLSNFVQWYLSQENLNNVSMFSTIRHFSNENRKIQFCITSLLRIVKSLKYSLSEINMSKVIIIFFFFFLSFSL
jgi:hypothetical protein